MKKGLLIIALVSFSSFAQSQVLISILLGDKLNSDKLEFGLEGGWNLMNINGLEESKPIHGFNLGFYFDIKLFKNNRNLMLNTGVIVKSPMGAGELPVYSLNNAALDTAFKDGYVDRKLRYFNVPILLKYQFKNRIFVKGGVMLGLKNNAYDNFVAEVKEKEDLNYKLDTKKKYHPIDAGGMVGIGYRLLGGNGMNLGIQYYHGFVDITVDDATSNQYNSSFYATVCIPIGKGKAEKKAAE